MKFIAARLASQGFVNRKHLMVKYGISMPQASTDLRVFALRNPAAMSYNLTTKRYEAL